jgi:hypothetical protein
MKPMANMRLQMGRSPEALNLPQEKQHLLGYVNSLRTFYAGYRRDRFMFDKIMPLSNADKGYDIFDKMKAQKVVFEVRSLAEAKN